MQTFLCEYLDVEAFVSACHIHHLLRAEILCQKPSSKRELLISLYDISILVWGLGVVLQILKFRSVKILDWVFHCRIILYGQDL